MRYTPYLVRYELIAVPKPRPAFEKNVFRNFRRFLAYIKHACPLFDLPTEVLGIKYGICCAVESLQLRPKTAIRRICIANQSRPLRSGLDTEEKICQSTTVLLYASATVTPQGSIPIYRLLQARPRACSAQTCMRQKMPLSLVLASILELASEGGAPECQGMHLAHACIAQAFVSTALTLCNTLANTSEPRECDRGSKSHYRADFFVTSPYIHPFTVSLSQCVAMWPLYVYTSKMGALPYSTQHRTRAPTIICLHRDNDVIFDPRSSFPENPGKD
jgi:hypothetical protein